jgi:predicted Zn-dependent protease
MRRGLRWAVILVLVSSWTSAPLWAAPEGRPGATAEERQLGALAAEQIIRQHGLLRDDDLQARLDSIGRGLAKLAPGGGEGYRFRILKSDDVNAMTTPDGQVFVTRALLRAFKGDNELAAVLAHEISHVILGHTARLLTEPDEVRTVEVRKKNGRMVRRTMTVTSPAKKRWEFEADAAGLDLLTAAGYPLNAMEHVLEYLTAEENETARPAREADLEDAKSTHPRSADRLDALRKLLAARAAAAHPRDPGPPAAHAGS